MEDYIYIIGIALISIFIVCLIKLILKNPFKYPYLYVTIDISHRRNVDYEDEIDRLLCEDGLEKFLNHDNYVQEWKADTKRIIKESILRRYRQSQFESILDDCNMFIFVFTRNQTRYKQQNYVKHKYKVAISEEEISYDISRLIIRYNSLKAIDFECTLKEYNMREQRKLMTPELKKQIKERDHYTCQICGKHMPDEIGLQIDHKIPVSKGGKTIPSNLQVLCSKCNGRKSNKLV